MFVMRFFFMGNCFASGCHSMFVDICTLKYRQRMERKKKKCKAVCVYGTGLIEPKKKIVFLDRGIQSGWGLQ